jgi:hypothetical protein
MKTNTSVPQQLTHISWEQGCLQRAATKRSHCKKLKLRATHRLNLSCSTKFIGKTCSGSVWKIIRANEDYLLLRHPPPLVNASSMLTKVSAGQIDQNWNSADKLLFQQLSTVRIRQCSFSRLTVLLHNPFRHRTTPWTGDRSILRPSHYALTLCNASNGGYNFLRPGPSRLTCLCEA